MNCCHLALFILLIKVSQGVSEEQAQCETSFSEQRYAFPVTRKVLERSRVLGRVSFNTCSSNSRVLYSPDDTRFRVFPDGKVTVKRQLTLHDGSVSFVLNAWDATGNRHSATVLVWNQREQQRTRRHTLSIQAEDTEGHEPAATSTAVINATKPYVKSKEMYGGSECLLTTHVLNSAQGIPAKGLTLTLSKYDASQSKWVQVSRSVTNEDGRCPGLLRGEHLTAGTFQLRFDTGDYWKKMQQESFYPYVEIAFTITDPKQKYHVPLLLSPFSYTTYRGS